MQGDIADPPNNESDVDKISFGILRQHASLKLTDDDLFAQRSFLKRVVNDGWEGTEEAKNRWKEAVSKKNGKRQLV